MNSGQIVKAKRKNKFTILPNEVLQNPNLSFRAKGLLSYILSLPEDWVIYVDELSNHSSEGRDAVRTAFRELQKHGYIVSVKIIDEHTKQIKGWSHIAYDYPAIDGEKASRGKPDAEFPRAEKPTSGNPPLQRTNSTKKKETKKTSDYGETQKLKIDDDVLNFYSEYCKESGHTQTTANRVKTEKQFFSLSDDERELAVSKYKEFINYRKSKQVSDFGETESKYIPRAFTYLQDKLWEEIPKRRYLIQEPLDDGTFRYRFEDDGKPAYGYERFLDHELKKFYTI